MSVTHHPAEALLLDYVTGALPEAWSLPIATHLAFCPNCRQAVRDIEALGGALLADEKPSGTADGPFDAVMRAIEAHAPSVSPSEAASADDSLVPAPLRAYIGADLDKLAWRRIGPGAQQALVPVADGDATVRLFRIAPGTGLPEHSHRGTEMTVVLSGAFEDHTGRYGPGDLQEADENLVHRQVITRDAACVCLAVLDAPLQFTGFAARLLQPLIGL